MLAALQCRIGCKNGNLMMLQWLKKKNCSINGATFSHAAQHGDLENIKWLKNKCQYGGFSET